MDDLRSKPHTRSSSSSAVNTETQPKILEKRANLKEMLATTRSRGQGSHTENEKPRTSGSPGQMCGGACKSQLISGKDSIECERCEKRFCLKCSALSSEEFGLFTKMNAAHWFCPPCEFKAMEAVKMDQIVEERCKKFLGETQKRLEKLEQMSNGWSKVEELCKRLESDVKEIKSSLTDKQRMEPSDIAQDVLASSVQSIFQDCVKEESEKDKRKHNIVVYGLAENDSEDGKERQYYDTASTRGMLDYLEIEGEVKRVIRLGRRQLDASETSSRPRPVLVEFSNADSSAEAKRKASKLRFGPKDFKELYIQADLTKTERAARNELVKEMKRRKSEGDNNWMIRGEKLVKRKDPPSQPSNKGKQKGPRPFQDA